MGGEDEPINRKRRKRNKGGYSVAERVRVGI